MEALFDALQTLGHARYANAEQLLPGEVVEQIRKRGLPGKLAPQRPKSTGWKPPEAREVVNLDVPRQAKVVGTGPTKKAVALIPVKAPIATVPTVAAQPTIAPATAKPEPPPSEARERALNEQNT